MMIVMSLDAMVPAEHPLRAIKSLADEALSKMGGTFEEKFSEHGRPSIPPERLLKGLLLMALYSIRSERQLCEQIRYNFLYRWFLDMNGHDEVFDASTYSKARASGRLSPDVTASLLSEVVSVARRRSLLSEEHFSVDGTLVEAWASMKSFRPKDEDDDNTPDGPKSNGWVDFKGEKRSNDTHESKTDPESRLMRKGLGKEAKLSFAVNVLMENRNGLVVDVETTTATGTSEREAAIVMLDRQLEQAAESQRMTLGADRAYDDKKFVEQVRERGVTPHIVQNETRRSAIDGRTTRHAGYAVSVRKRMQIECAFGWGKLCSGMRKMKVRGLARVATVQHVIASALNLIRIAKLTTA